MSFLGASVPQCVASVSDVRIAHTIRWALVPVAAVVAWAAALFVGLLLHDWATRLCPEFQIVSGACVAPWWPYADASVLCVSAAFAAASIVIACSLTAPSHRGRVAVAVYIIGAVWAVFLAIAGAAYWALPCAAAAGAWGVWWIRRKAPRPSP
jgi:hypothetical protein